MSGAPIPKSKFPSLAGLTRSEAIDLLWRKGVLYWKLDSCQKQLYDKFTKTDFKTVVWNCSRQLGKSWTLIILALEYCLQNPNVQVKYCAGTAKAVSKIIKPTLRRILVECPKDLTPKYNREMGCYVFPNGSLLYIEGLDGGKAEDLRGTPMHFGIIDEAGFVDDLDYVVNSILLPMTSTTKGRILIVSTPAKQAGHEFTNFLRVAEYEGAYIKKTIYDFLKDVENDPPHFKERLTLEEVERLKKATNPNAWRREYLCEIIADSDSTVIPEFTDEIQLKCIKEWPKPLRFDTYESMDLGVKDLTAIIFAYYDFKEGKLIIEDEFSCHGQQVNTSFIARNIKEKEAQLWTNAMTGEIQQVYRRIADTNEKIAQQDLSRQFGITFIPTRKDDKDAAINDVRIKIQEERIIINPRCKQLIFHLKNATWNKARKSFERSPDSGHFDFIDALIYLVRNIDWNKNPYPFGWNMAKDSFIWKPTEAISNSAQTIKNIFIKKR